MARPRRYSLSAFLEDGRTPVVVLDERGVVRLVSPGFETLTGWKAADLQDLVCQRSAPRTASSLEILANAFCPPAVIGIGRSETRAVVVPHRDGKALRLDLTLTNTETADGEQATVITAVLATADTPQTLVTGESSIARRLFAEINALRIDLRRRFGTDSFIGRSPEIVRALAQAEVAFKSQAPFLIHGPEGSGRTHLARLIHCGGKFAENSFASIDCRLLSKSELVASIHRLRQASSVPSALPHQKIGMVFFRDVQWMAREVQNWFLNEMTVESRQLWIAASSDESVEQLLKREVLAPEFTARLNILQIQLPPLHRRGDDVVLLAQQFIEESKRDHRTPVDRISESLRTALLNYRWPGNVRELRKTIDLACRNCSVSELQPEHLPFSFRVGEDAQRFPIFPASEVVPLETLLREFEREVIESALASCDGNKAEAARRLGLTRPKLYRRLESLGLADEP